MVFYWFLNMPVFDWKEIVSLRYPFFAVAVEVGSPNLLRVTTETIGLEQLVDEKLLTYHVQARGSLLDRTKAGY